MTDKTIDPHQALDNFFQVVRQEAVKNPDFAKRMIEAIGHPVLFRGDQAKYAVDPIIVAKKGIEEFRTTFLSFSAADLKNMIKEHALATQSDLKGKTKPPQLVELMWKGASAKLNDRGQ